MRSIALVSVMCVALAFAAGCHAGSGKGPVSVSESEAIFVVGEGQATGRPDRIRLSLGVEAKADTLEEAMADNVKRTTSLREALLKLGVAEKDLRTGQFNISQIREPITVRVTEPAAPAGSAEKSAPVQPPRVEERWVERYFVSNTLDVSYPDLTRAGELISAAVAAGANQSWGLRFEVTDPKPLQNQAREAALKDARARAEQLAQIAGVKLGRVLSINDQGAQENDGGAPIYRHALKAEAASMDASVPVEGGESRVQAAVQVAFAIER